MEAVTYTDRRGRSVLGIALDTEQEDQIGLDSKRQLAEAIEAFDPEDSSSIRWLAVFAINRALDLEPR